MIGCELGAFTLGMIAAKGGVRRLVAATVAAAVRRRRRRSKWKFGIEDGRSGFVQALYHVGGEDGE